MTKEVNFFSFNPENGIEIQCFEKLFSSLDEKSLQAVLSVSRTWRGIAVTVIRERESSRTQQLLKIVGQYFVETNHELEKDNLAIYQTKFRSMNLLNIKTCLTQLNQKLSKAFQALTLKEVKELDSQCKTLTKPKFSEDIFKQAIEKLQKIEEEQTLQVTCTALVNEEKIDQALELARPVTEKSPHLLIEQCKVAAMQFINQDSPSQSLKTAQLIFILWGNSQMTGSVLEDISAAFVNKGHINLSIDIADWISDDSIQAGAIKFAGMGYAQEGNLEGLITVKDRLDLYDQNYTSVFIIEACTLLVKSQNFDKALAFAQLMEKKSSNPSNGQLAREGVKIAENQPEQATKVAKVICSLWKNDKTVDQIATALAQKGHLESCLQVAEWILDLSIRAEVLITAGIGYAQEGNLEGLITVKNRLDLCDQNHTSVFIIGACTLLVENQNFDKALTLAQLMKKKSSSPSNGQLTREAVRIAENQPEQATKIAKVICSLWKNDKTVDQIATALAQKGHLESCLQVAEWILNQSTRAEVLTTAGIEYTKKRDLKKIVEIAHLLNHCNQNHADTFLQKSAVIILENKDLIPRFKETDQYLREISITLAKKRMPQHSFDVLDLIENTSNRTLALESCFKAYIENRDFKHALFANDLLEVETSLAKVVEKILTTPVNRNMKKEVLKVAGIAYAERGNEEKVMEAASLLDPDNPRLANELLYEASLIMARNANYDQSLRTAQAISKNNPYLQSSALEEIAKIFIKMNTPDRALDVVDLLCKLSTRDFSLNYISLLFAKKGNSKHSLDVINLILSESMRSTTLKETFEIYAENGNIEEAIQIGNLLFSEANSGEIVTKIFMIYTSQETINAALKVACDLSDQQFWAAFKVIIVRLLRDAEVNAIMEIGEHFPDESKFSEFLENKDSPIDQPTQNLIKRKLKEQPIYIDTI